MTERDAEARAWEAWKAWREAREAWLRVRRNCVTVPPKETNQ